MRTFVRDSENTLLLAPNDYTGNRFIGNGWNFIAQLNQNMLYEPKEKYENRYNAQLKAEAELENLPKCFNQCVDDVTTGLNS